ncbi:MAG: 4-(cytidine 5'-diphospho)-2-C-methyl-D-erythritol kinase [Lachnospiraceae bacterium]|mgnify:CR=1 FL=1|nr:4-(cytidine 5'-diphospho)-2-C-methyl-D-erythritol kinase [Lachnospiraceae bacterium]
MDRMTLKARAKVNIGLDITGVLDNGYHLVDMIMQTLQMHDEVTIRKKRERGIEIRSNLRYLPVNENNIVYQAAKMMVDEFQIQDGLRFDIKKEIPVAAGMAGGSADAASALIGINRMYQLSLSTEELCIRGLQLGADVPYCIQGGTMHATGIGEKLERITAMPDCFVVVVKPKASASTKVVYQKFDQLEQVKHPNMTQLLLQMEGMNLNGIADAMGNVLEQVTISMIPEIATIKEVLLKNGALNAMMSGSGPTVFGLYTNRAQADRAVAELSNKKSIQKACVTKFWNK